MRTRTGHLHKRNGIYHVQWRIDGRLFKRSTGTRNRKEAERRRTEIMAPFVSGDESAVLRNVTAAIEGRKEELDAWDAKNNPPMKVLGAWREYVVSTNRPDTGESTLRQYEYQFGHFAQWMEKNHAGATLRDVTSEIADEYSADLIRSGKSSNTYNKYLNLLQLVFRVLKKKARLTENPWEDIQRKKLNPNTRRELTLEELRRVCESAEGELRLLFSMGIYTGLRLGDCATLLWGEVDLERGLIQRVPNKVRRNRKSVQIPIHPVLGEMLNGTSRQERQGYVLPEIAESYMRRIDSVTDQVQLHFQSCGIETHKAGTGKVISTKGVSTGERAVVLVGFHSLRHTFVSLCRDSNAPLAVVEAIVGHSNPAMTRLYTHVGEAAAGAAVSALPSIVERRPQSIPEAKAVVAAAPLRSLVEQLPETKKVAPIKEKLLNLLAG